jgi:hypothetical protein
MVEERTPQADRLAELQRQLSLTSVLLFTFSSPFVTGIRGFRFNHYQHDLVIFGWVLLLLSIVLGIGTLYRSSVGGPPQMLRPLVLIQAAATVLGAVCLFVVMATTLK